MVQCWIRSRRAAGSGCLRGSRSSFARHGPSEADKASRQALRCLVHTLPWDGLRDHDHHMYSCTDTMRDSHHNRGIHGLLFPGDGLRLHARLKKQIHQMDPGLLGGSANEAYCHQYRLRQQTQRNRMDASGGLICSCLCYCCSAPACATADVESPRHADNLRLRCSEDWPN